MTNKYLVSCVLGQREGAGAGKGGQQRGGPLGGGLERRNEDELQDAENNTSNKLVVTAQSGKDCLASQPRYLGQRLTYFQGSHSSY